MIILIMIKRRDYLNALKTALSRSRIAAILGPRQCGKTTLAKEYTKNNPCVFLDLESPSDYAKLENPEMFLSSIPGLIVIDEIQLKPALFPVLRVLADKYPENKRFLILGSASPDLLKNASETLAGRIEFIDLHGFNITETGKKTWKKLWIRGGFPRSFLAESEQDSNAWREGFIRTFLQRDIPQLGINIPAPALRRFWTMLAHSHGQILNSSELAKSMGLSDKTIKSYLDILNATYMVRQLQPWHENIKKRQIKSPKIYLRDSGIFHQLLGIQDFNTLSGHPKIGSSWEGYALEQILFKNPGIEPYFWGTYSGGEIDLLIIKDGKKIGYEFKYTETPKTSKSMFSALETLSLDEIRIIYPGEETYPVHEHIIAETL
jgi:uncharacterized protein